jgi:hypothetical protein
MGLLRAVGSVSNAFLAAIPEIPEALIWYLEQRQGIAVLVRLNVTVSKKQAILAMAHHIVLPSKGKGMAFICWMMFRTV